MHLSLLYIAPHKPSFYLYYSLIQWRAEGKKGGGGGNVTMTLGIYIGDDHAIKHLVFNGKYESTQLNELTQILPFFTSSFLYLCPGAFVYFRILLFTFPFLKE